MATGVKDEFKWIPISVPDLLFEQLGVHDLSITSQLISESSIHQPQLDVGRLRAKPFDSGIASSFPRRSRSILLVH